MLPHRNNVAFHPKSTTNNKLNLATYRISLCLAFYVRYMANLSLHFISNARHKRFLGPLFWKCATHFFIPLVQFIMFFMFSPRVQWFPWTSYQTRTLRTKTYISFVDISSETIENERISLTLRASLAILWSRSTQIAAKKMFLLIIHENTHTIVDFFQYSATCNVIQWASFNKQKKLHSKLSP